MGDGRIALTPQIRRLAQRLVLGSGGKATDQLPSPIGTFLNFERLQMSLNSVAGAAGGRALLSRALALTKAEFPKLASITLDKRGNLNGLSDIAPPLTQQEADEGEILLVGNTVGLLCTFLGQAMALRLIQDQWPDASFDEESGKERKA